MPIRRNNINGKSLSPSIFNLICPLIKRRNINAINGSIHDHEVTEALYGSTQYSFKRDESGFPLDPEMIRLPDGVWRNYNGPVYTRVSAVLLAKNLRTDNISRADIKLYHNPWAQKVCSSVLNNLTQVVYEQCYIKEKSGTHLADIIGLPLSWPED